MSAPVSKLAKNAKSTTQIYRDCLRMVRHMAGESPKALQINMMVRSEFRRNMEETDPIVVEDLKFRAIRGLSNYMVLNSASKDPALMKRMKDAAEGNNTTTSSEDTNTPPTTPVV